METMVKLGEMVLLDPCLPLTPTERLEGLSFLDGIGYRHVAVWGHRLAALVEDVPGWFAGVRERLTATQAMVVLGDGNTPSRSGMPPADVLALAKDHGVALARLGDVRNELTRAEPLIRCALELGYQVEGVVTHHHGELSASEAARLAGRLAKMGVHALCLDDPSGRLTPSLTLDLVEAMRNRFEVPLCFSSRNGGWLAPAAAWAAVKAGAETLDGALSASPGAPPATESLAAMLADTPYDPGIAQKSFELAALHYGRTVTPSNSRQNGAAKRSYAVRVQGGTFRVDITPLDRAAPASSKTPSVSAASHSEKGAAEAPLTGEIIQSPMQGRLVRFAINEGERVEARQRVAVLEAMKMENDIVSPVSGVLRRFLAAPGQVVKSGQALAVVE